MLLEKGKVDMMEQLTTQQMERIAMLQLRNALVFIEKYYADQYNAAHYFAAIEKGAFYTLVVDSRESGSITV